MHCQRADNGALDGAKGRRSLALQAPHGSCGKDFKRPYLFLLPVRHGCHVEEQVQDDGVLCVLPNAVQQVRWQGCLHIMYKDRTLLDTQCEPLREGNVKTAVFKNRQSYRVQRQPAWDTNSNLVFYAQSTNSYQGETLTEAHTEIVIFKNRQSCALCTRAPSVRQ